ncbi:MAG TPA: hypothetical protein VII63_04235 [Caulobacteraceae bacterium]
MRLKTQLAVAAAVLFGVSGAWAQGRNQPGGPTSSDSLLNPGYHHPLDPEIVYEPARAARAQALAAGSLDTLPTWTRTFTISGKTYSAALVGTGPLTARATVIPTVIVPIRLTVSDYSVNGKTPLVLDGTKVLNSVLGSPIFQTSPYSSGDLQFSDAMLRAEFPLAPGAWHTLFSPSVGPTLDIVAPAHSVRVYRAKSGKLLGIVRDDLVIDSAIYKALAQFSPQSYVVFVTYNALEHDAFGYHAFVYGQKKSQAIVYTYTSWLEGVDDLFSVPSPDAATLAHEIAEVVHDPLITSVTLLWGDAFAKNRCFQRTIEVGDAIENAPADVQLWEQTVGSGGDARTFTLQNEALLPWFERQTPSRAQGGAYSFPSVQALASAAPLTCVK